MLKYVPILICVISVFSIEEGRPSIPLVLEEIEMELLESDGAEATVGVTYHSLLYESMRLGIAASATLGWDVRAQSDLIHTEDRPEILPQLRVTVSSKPGTEIRNGDFVVVRILATNWERLSQAHGTKLYLQMTDGKLQLASEKAYLQTMEAEPGNPAGIIFTGTVTPYGDEVRSPYDLPGISEEAAARLVAQMEGVEPISGALTASSPGNHSHPEQPAGIESDIGCSGGSGGHAACAIFVIAILLMRRLRGAAQVATLMTLIVFGGVLSTAAAAICGYGNIVFWDGRTNGQGADDTTPLDGIFGPVWSETNYVNYGGAARNGWRLRECNSASAATCAPNVANCCFSPISNAQLTLLKSVSGGPFNPVTTTNAGTDDGGYFSVCDNSPTPGAVYKLRVHYRSSSVSPTLFEVEPQATGAAMWTDIPIAGMAIPHGPVGQISVNPAQDTTSVGADVANLYAVMRDTFVAIEAQGETRHQKKFNSAPNTRDLIECTYAGTPMGTTFSDSRFAIGTPFTHGWAAAHEIGHIFTARVVNALFFANNPEGIDPTKRYSSEGISLNEAFSDFIAFLYQFDPNTVGLNGIINTFSFWPCAGVPDHPATNRASTYGNNVLGLWELLDSDQGNAHHGTFDTIDLNLKNIADGMVALKADTSGGNGSINEGSYALAGAACNVSTQACAVWGQVCDEPGGVCINGDVHGENVRDWARHMGSGSTFQINLRNALISNQCLGPVDNTGSTPGVTPGTGGFRDD